MKILIDMNLSPSWVDFFHLAGIDSVHWSMIGDIKADDSDIMQFAIKNNYIIFTHDLDFGAILALSNLGIPSVIQSNVGYRIINALKQFEDVLNQGALIIIDDIKQRARILPLMK
jgi:predicted nuclease of predicted toxin-antitoxin system